MLQVHKPECNIFQLHMNWYHILARGKIRKVMLVTEQWLPSWVIKETQEYTKIVFWAREHWLHWDSALSALLGFIDILVGSSISLYSAYIVCCRSLFDSSTTEQETQNKMRDLWCWNIMMYKVTSYNYYKKYL